MGDKIDYCVKNIEKLEVVCGLTSVAKPGSFKVKYAEISPS